MCVGEKGGGQTGKGGWVDWFLVTKIVDLFEKIKI